MIDHRLALAIILAAAAPNAMAQTVVAPSNVTAEDVMTKPLSDLNLKKAEIPPILQTAREQPYALAGLRTCRALSNEIGQLNAVLGDDIDIGSEKTRAEKRGNTVGSVAKSVITGFIPFNGVIREISGAAGNDRQWQVALYAGASRRAFLKGYGQSRGCPYPARAATARDAAKVLQKRAEPEAATPEPGKGKVSTAKKRRTTKARRRRT